MRLNLTRKIGGGFAVLLVFTCIVSYIAIRAMYGGIRVSEETATDNMPKLTSLNALLGNLLLGTYNMRVFFETGDDQSLARGQDFLKRASESLNAFRALNEDFPGETETAFIQQFEKDFSAFNDAAVKGVDVARQTEAATQSMLDSASTSINVMRKLISTMGQTLRGFVEQGNFDAARQYSHNMDDADAIVARVLNVQRDLLVAERRRDVQAFSALEATLAGIDADARKIREHLLLDEYRAMFDTAGRAYADFSNQVRQLVALQIESARLNDTRVASYNAAYEEVRKVTEVLSNRTVEEVGNTYTLLSNSRNVVTAAVAIILLLGICLSITLTRMVTRPLAKTQVFAQAVAHGDLDRELDVTGTDETGLLADDLRLMVATLKQKIAEANRMTEEAHEATDRAQVATQQAQEAARQAETAKRDGMMAAAGNLEGSVGIISSASVELSAQIEHASGNAQEIAQRLQEVAAAMNEMTATVQEVAKNSATAASMADQARGQAIVGKDVVRRSLQSTQTLHTLSVKLKNDMGDLQDKTTAITGIMGVISDIADQTNLLALNAAIEAARAGEAGRGFAVVADEVRKLAEKTMSSTADVERAIAAINASMNESLHAVETAVNQIETSTELAEQAEGALQNIVADAESAANEIQSIATASEEQSATSDEINRSINSVNELTSQSSAAMNECAQAVAELARQSQELGRLVENMKAG